MKNYPLSSNPSIAELCNVLEHLRDDAKDKAIPPAMFYAEHGGEEKRADAMFYIGQIRLIGNLLWALDGTAQRDGSDPSVWISDRP